MSRQDNFKEGKEMATYPPLELVEDTEVATDAGGPGRFKYDGGPKPYISKKTGKPTSEGAEKVKALKKDSARKNQARQDSQKRLVTVAPQVKTSVAKRGLKSVVQSEIPSYFSNRTPEYRQLHDWILNEHREGRDPHYSEIFKHTEFSEKDLQKLNSYRYELLLGGEAKANKVFEKASGPPTPNRVSSKYSDLFNETKDVKLSREEAQAVISNQDLDSFGLNHYLSTGEIESESDHEHYGKLSDTLSKVVAKYSFKSDTTLHRGISYNEGVSGSEERYNKFVDELMNASQGDVIESKAFMSTSSDPKEAKKWTNKGKNGLKFEIGVKSGQNGIPVDRWASEWGKMNEVLLDKGSRFQVESVDKKNRIVRLSLIGKNTATDSIAVDYTFIPEEHPRMKDPDWGGKPQGGGESTSAEPERPVVTKADIPFESWSPAEQSDFLRRSGGQEPLQPQFEAPAQEAAQSKSFFSKAFSSLKSFFDGPDFDPSRRKMIKKSAAIVAAQAMPHGKLLDEVFKIANFEPTAIPSAAQLHKAYSTIAFEIGKKYISALKLDGEYHDEFLSGQIDELEKDLAKATTQEEIKEAFLGIKENISEEIHMIASGELDTLDDYDRVPELLANFQRAEDVYKEASTLMGIPLEELNTYGFTDPKQMISNMLAGWKTNIGWLNSGESTSAFKPKISFDETGNVISKETGEILEGPNSLIKNLEAKLPSPKVESEEGEGSGEREYSEEEINEPDKYDEEGQPETEQPETEQPETEQPETEQPETEQPETKQPETEQPKSKYVDIVKSTRDKGAYYDEGITSHVFNIQNEEGKRIGSGAIEERPKYYRMWNAGIDNPEEKGKGYGVKAYRHWVDRAISEGKEFRSDSEVTPDVMRVYESLKRQGYNVELNPKAEVIEGGKLYTKHGSVYKITKGPETEQPEPETPGVEGEEPSDYEGSEEVAEPEEGDLDAQFAEYSEEVEKVSKPYPKAAEAFKNINQTEALTREEDGATSNWFAFNEAIQQAIQIDIKQQRGEDLTEEEEETSHDTYVSEIIDRLSSAISKYEVTKDVTLYRGIHTDYFKGEEYSSEANKAYVESFINASPGDIVNSDLFSSFSPAEEIGKQYSEDKKDGVLLVLSVKKGQHTLPIPYSIQPETIIDRGSQFRIESVDKEKRIVQLTLMGLEQPEPETEQPETEQPETEQPETEQPESLEEIKEPEASEYPELKLKPEENPEERGPFYRDLIANKYLSEYKSYIDDGGAIPEDGDKWDDLATEFQNKRNKERREAESAKFESLPKEERIAIQQKEATRSLRQGAMGGTSGTSLLKDHKSFTQIESLTSKQKELISYYQHDCTPFNNPLHTGEYKDEQNKQEIEELSKACRSFKLNKDMKVSRYVDSEGDPSMNSEETVKSIREYAESLLGGKPGDIIENKSFTSTTAWPKLDLYAGGKSTIHLKFTLTRGQHALNINTAGSDFEDQREVLLDRGSQFRIESVDKKNRIVHVTLMKNEKSATDSILRRVYDFSSAWLSHKDRSD